MHNDHDLDLITALAEGRLEDPAAAEDLVATCPECAQVFDSHRTVLEAVALQDPVFLDDFERRRLRSAVWEALELEEIPVTTAIPRPSGALWWYRVGAVAAALFVVVGVGSQLVSERGDETGATFATTGGELAPTDRFNTFEGPAAGSEEQFTEETSSAAQDEAASSEEADSPATTAAGADTSGLQVDADDLAEAAAQFGRRASASEEAHSESALTCASQDQAAPAAPVVATEPVDVDGAPAWFVAFGSESEIVGVNVYVDETCEVLYRDE